MALAWGGAGGIERSLEAIGTRLGRRGEVVRIGFRQGPGADIDVVVPRSPFDAVIRLAATGPVAAAAATARWIRSGPDALRGVDAIVSRSLAMSAGVIASGLEVPHVYVPPAAMSDFYRGAEAEARRLGDWRQAAKLRVLRATECALERFVMSTPRVRVVTFSRNVAESVLHGGRPIETLRPGVDPAFTAPLDAPPQLRRALGLSPDAFLAVYVGRLEAGKNVDVLMAAARRLNADPRVEVLVVGDGRHREALRSLASPNVRFLGGRAPADVARIVAASDLLVLPTYEEGFGFVLAEALSAGTPILGYGSPAGRTAIDEFHDTFGHRCLVLRERGDAALAAGIAAAADGGHLAAPERDALRRAAASVFDWDRLVDALASGARREDAGARVP